MITLKKLALMGVASLAALSVSCSETDDAEAGGAFNPALSVTLDSDGFATLGGKIVANTGTNVLAVVVTADGFVVGTTPTLVGGATVDLTNVTVTGVCAATGATTNKSFAIKVTATFDGGDPISDTKNIAIDCSTPTPSDPNLVKQSITLSGAGTSYSDLDATPVATYQRAVALAASTIDKIDIVAFDGVGDSGDANAIYAPIELDRFYDDSGFLGSNVSFFPLGADGVAAINAATKLSQVAPFFENLGTFINIENPQFEIPISTTPGFLVLTSEGQYVAVIITSSGASTVTLGTTKFAIED